MRFLTAARSAHWWDDKEGVIGGRDCLGGGTWLCCHVDGRVAFLTNFRKKLDGPTHSPQQSNIISRGVLPTNFVTSTDTSPFKYLSQINGAAYSHYGAGFNLVVADLGNPPEYVENFQNKIGKDNIDEEEEQQKRQSTSANSSISSQVYYMTNAQYFGDTDAPTDPIPLPPGIHGLSNAVLDTPWPKVALGRRKFNDLAGCGAFDGDEFPWDAVFAIMKESTVLETDPNKLPDTGYGADFESAASALFMNPVVVGNIGNNKILFGTRSVAVLAVPRDGSPAELREQYLTEQGGWAEERHRFHMKQAEHLPKLD